jgi:O-antigen/teichoic acid export membrane protein
VAVMEGEPTPDARQGLVARLRAALGGSSEASVTKRLAGTVFIIRVFSAGLAYFSQVLLARWMGTSDYGVYVYVWTWVLLLGSMMDFGMSVSAQKFIPEYRSTNRLELLRGFLIGVRWLTFSVSLAVAILLAGVVHLLSPWLDPQAIKPLMIGCIILPGFVVANVQDGIARSHDWMRLALMPQFVVRQSMIIGFTVGVVALGMRISADIAMIISAIAVWVAVLAQMLLLNRRLVGAVEPGPKSFSFRVWLATSLPILMVEGFYLLLSYVDILVLQHFRNADEVGIYHAIVKTLALVSFVHYAMSATTAHRFSEYHTSGDRERLSAYLAHAIKWTFWPSVAATALLLLFGKPLLWLFGPEFTAGYPVMFVLAIGLIARSAIGPVEKLLNMVGLQNVCAFAYAAAFVLNLILCVLLVPRFGMYGAAASTSIALISESILLFWITRRRLGLHVLASW